MRLLITGAILAFAILIFVIGLLCYCRLICILRLSFILLIDFIISWGGKKTNETMLYVI